jgi:hypothetical protein
MKEILDHPATWAIIAIAGLWVLSKMGLRFPKPKAKRAKPTAVRKLESEIKAAQKETDRKAAMNPKAERMEDVTANSLPHTTGIRRSEKNLK